MSDDIQQGLGATSETASGEGGESQTVVSGTDTGGAKPGVDFTKSPTFTAMQSQLDKEKAARVRLERENQQAQRKYDMLARQLQQANPDALGYALQVAEVDDLRNKVAQYDYERQVAAKRDEEKQYHLIAAQEAGIDPSDPRYQAALNSGDHRAVERVKAELIRESERAALKQPSPAKQAEIEALREKEKAGDYFNLPATGGSPDGRDIRRREYEQEKQKLTQGDVGALFELRRKYRDVAD